MSVDKDIEKLVDRALDSARSIQRVQTSPHFLTRVRARLRRTQELESQTSWSLRLRPSVALPVVALVILLDAAALFWVFRNPDTGMTSSDQGQFAAYYGLAAAPTALGVYDPLKQD